MMLGKPITLIDMESVVSVRISMKSMGRSVSLSEKLDVDLKVKSSLPSLKL